MTPISDGIGLYPGGNQIPEDHKQLGIEAATKVVKRNTAGEPDPRGKLVFAAIGGMSNARQEFVAFQKAYQNKYGMSRKITWFNGNRGAWDAKRIAIDDPVGYWQWFMDGLFKRNISPKQVQAAWIKNSVRGQNKPHPVGSNELITYLEKILGEATARFENLEQVFFTSANYSGYATKAFPRIEPYAYEEGLGVKKLIEDRLGRVKPWCGWSAYIWADGTNVRSDGLKWVRTDFEQDGVHPGPGAEMKIADLLMRFFENSLVTSV